MNDAAANKYINLYQDALIANAKAGNAQQFERTLRLLIKEVERDTRHKCSDLIHAAATQVHNLRWE